MAGRGTQMVAGKTVDRIIKAEERLGSLYFLVRFVGEARELWFDIDNMKSCNQKLLEFYQHYPQAPRCSISFSRKRGPLQSLVNPRDVRKSDVEANGHIIYAHWFVDCSNNSVMYRKSSAQILS